MINTVSRFGVMLPQNQELSIVPAAEELVQNASLVEFQ